MANLDFTVSPIPGEFDLDLNIDIGEALGGIGGRGNPADVADVFDPEVAGFSNRTNKGFNAQGADISPEQFTQFSSDLGAVIDSSEVLGLLNTGATEGIKGTKNRMNLSGTEDIPGSAGVSGGVHNIPWALQPEMAEAFTPEFREGFNSRQEYASYIQNELLINPGRQGIDHQPSDLAFKLADNADALHTDISAVNQVFADNGLQAGFRTDRGTYRYNATAGKYEYDSHGDSDLVQALNIGSSLIISYATGGIVNPVLQGAVTATVTVMRGGDLQDALTAGALSAITGYAEVADVAVSAAEAGVARMAAAGADTSTAVATLNAARTTATTANAISSSVRAIDAIANENYIGALTIGLDAAGLGTPKDLIANAMDPQDTGLVLGHLDTDALASAGWKFTNKMADGASPEEALASATVDYIKQGGTLNTGGFDLIPSLDFSLSDTEIFSQIEAVYHEYVEDPLEAFAQAVGDPIQEAGRFIDDTILQPIKDSIAPILQATEETLASIEDAFHENIEDPAEEIAQAIGDVLQEIEAPDLPDVDIDLPDIDFPDLDLPGLPDLSGLADFDFSGLDLHGVDLPEFDIALPDFDIDVPDFDIDLPEFDFTGADLDLDLPTLPDLPNLPELPDLPDIPDFNLPDVDVDLNVNVTAGDGTDTKTTSGSIIKPTDNPITFLQAREASDFQRSALLTMLLEGNDIDIREAFSDGTA